MKNNSLMNVMEIVIVKYAKVTMTNVDVDWNGDNTDTSERAFLRCGKNADNARILINGYAELGKKLGATTVEVTNAAQAWLRQGYDIAQVNDLVKSSLYLSKILSQVELTIFPLSSLHNRIITIYTS